MNDKNKRNNSIGRHLSIAHRALFSRMNQKLSSYDIHVGTFHLLLPLYKEEGVPQKKLCQIFNLGKGTVGKGLQKLEDKDFIERKEDPRDKRKKRVYLTKKSRKLEDEFKKILQETEEEAKQAFSHEETKKLLNLLKKVSENLGVEMEKINGGKIK